MNKEETRGRKMRSDNVRVIPEFRDQIDIEKLCQALIEIANIMVPLSRPLSQILS